MSGHAFLRTHTYDSQATKVETKTKENFCNNKRVVWPGMPFTSNGKKIDRKIQKDSAFGHPIKIPNTFKLALI